MHSQFRKRPILAAVLSASGSIAVGQDTDSGYYRVEGDALICIVENEDAYKAQGPLIIVDTTKCSENAEPGDWSESIVNEIPRTGNLPTGIATILALTPSNLSCLPGLVSGIEGTTVKYYPDACKVELE